MYAVRVDSNGRTLRVYDDRGGMLFMRTMPTRIEQVTVSGNLPGKIEMDERYFGGRRRGRRGGGALGKLPVFGILERGGKVKVEVVPDVRADCRRIRRRIAAGGDLEGSAGSFNLHGSVSEL